MVSARPGRRLWVVCGWALLVPVAGLAQAPYLPRIDTVEEFDLLSQAGAQSDRSLKLLLPAVEDPGLLPPLFQNVNLYRLHLDFLRAVFPERYGSLDSAAYFDLVEVRATRRYYAGILERIPTGDGLLYGFSIFTSAEASELLTQEELGAIYERLRGVFALEGLVYAPRTTEARLAAAAWVDPPFPVHLGSITTAVFQAYTLGAGYGRVRVLTLAELEAAVAAGRLTWQDIVVLDDAPRDIESVVAGVITAAPQTDLSHLSVRMARRGTPNAYVKGARAAFAPLEGMLVRLDVEPDGYTTAPAALPEAEAWWAAHRPKLSHEPRLDPAYLELDDLAAMDLDGPVAPEGRYGGKASNFARLQRILDGPFERYREDGFAVPCGRYIEFLRVNRTASRTRPGVTVTFEEYIGELLAAPDFQSDSGVRAAELARLRGLIDEGFVDPALTAAIAARIGDVFGGAAVPVRFRSSSNIEDDLEFNGAGLYDSTLACAADDLDSDGDGPSLCDPSEEKERRIGRALRKVWQSLWSFRAYEERAYYQIPQEKVAMAVLVSRAYIGERANAVAFTGTPTSPLDPRYVVNAQAGEESVVSPTPGVRAERTLLEVSDGVVRRLERLEASTLVGPGEVVFDDERLSEVAALLWHIQERFPVDLGPYPPERVIFDTELKVDPEGALAIKQVRPFLLAEAAPAGPSFRLVIPPGLSACGAFADGRSVADEHEAKSVLRFAPGTYVLEAGRPIFQAALVGEVLLGPAAEPAEPYLPGRFRVETTVGNGGVVTYSFHYEESFQPASGGLFTLEISHLDFEVRPGEEPPGELILDEALLLGGRRDELRELRIEGRRAGDPRGVRKVRYTSCDYGALPLHRGSVGLEVGDSILFEERFLDTPLGSGPASLVRAEVEIGGEARVVEDYFRLVYAALHHNLDVRYWIVLDPPVDLDGAGAVSIVEVEHPDPEIGVPARVRYLDAARQPLASPVVSCFRRAQPGEDLQPCGFGRFRRGDVSASGAVNITDPILLLAHLFQGGAAPTCLDAGDFDDDQNVEITDAILILTFLFRGADLSAPPGPHDCGADPTPDVLGECVDASCR